MVSTIPVFLLIIGTVSAVLWSNKLQPKPKEFANMTGCYIKEINNVIPFNDSVNAPGYCYLIHCTTQQIDYASCGITAAEHENCVVIESEPNEPYPECCPRVKCYEADLPWLITNNKTDKRSNTGDKNRRFKNP